MNQNETLQFLSTCLSTGLSTGLSARLESDQLNREDLAQHLQSLRDWTPVFSAAGDSLITPGLFVALNHAGLLPMIEAEAATYLEHIYSANLQRNQRILQEFCAVCTCLNQSGINPTPLKGAALLLDGTYTDPGERILTDMDLLVEVNELPQAIAAIKAAGYWQEDNEYPIAGQADFRNQAAFVVTHVPIFFKAGTVASIELHLSPAKIHQRVHQPMLDFIHAESTVQTYHGSHYNQLSTNTHLLINVWHSQKKDQTQARGVLDLRRLKDFSLLCNRYDLPQLQATLKTAKSSGLQRYFYDSYLQAKFFYQQPALDVEVPASAMFRHQWFLTINRSPTLFRIAHAVNQCRHYLQRFLSVHTLRAQFGPRNLFIAYGLRFKRVVRLSSLMRNVRAILNSRDNAG